MWRCKLLSRTILLGNTAKSYSFSFFFFRFKINDDDELHLKWTALHSSDLFYKQRKVEISIKLMSDLTRYAVTIVIGGKQLSSLFTLV